MKIIGLNCSVRGKRNAALERNCEDFSRNDSNSDKIVCAVSDGCSAAVYARDGAEINVNTALNVMLGENQVNYSDIDSFKRSMAEKLAQPILDKAKELDTLPEELSATLCAVSVDKEGVFTAVSVGDSTVIALTADGNLSVVITPYNFLTKNHTVFTCNKKECRKRMSVYKGNVLSENIRGLFLLTDGAAGYFCDDGGSIKNDDFFKMLCDCGSDERQDKLEEMSNKIRETTYDDVTIAALIISDSEEDDFSEDEELDGYFYDFDDDDSDGDIFDDIINGSSSGESSDTADGSSEDVVIVESDESDNIEYEASEIRRIVTNIDSPVGIRLYIACSNVKKG